MDVAPQAKPAAIAPCNVFVRSIKTMLARRAPPPIDFHQSAESPGAAAREPSMPDAGVVGRAACSF
jgi:hypothetical protein